MIGAYGSGAAPKITQGNQCVDLEGSHVRIDGLHGDDCRFAGVYVTGDGNVIADSVMTRNIVGVSVRAYASETKVLDNELRDNDKMSVNDPEPNNDSGAFGVLVHGEKTEIAGNRISGSDAASYDYGRDGAAVEVYGGTDTHVHHNLAIDNDKFSELGEPGTADTTFAYNVVRSSLADSGFVTTRGADGPRGPILRTKLYNNSVLMTGAGSQGFVCHDGCTSDILRMRNNIIEAVGKVGFADGDFDEDHDLFFGGQAQFSLGPSSTVADPRFVDAAAGDLRLQASSPAIDAGVSVPGYTTDHDGQPVPFDGDANGSSQTDEGAFEYRP